jgi:hypothetical protein
VDELKAYILSFTNISTTFCCIERVHTDVKIAKNCMRKQANTRQRNGKNMGITMKKSAKYHLR